MCCANHSAFKRSRPDKHGQPFTARLLDLAYSIFVNKPPDTMTFLSGCSSTRH
jgi:hypothetical protein